MLMAEQPRTNVNRDSSVSSDPFDAALAFAYGPNGTPPAAPKPSGVCVAATVRADHHENTKVRKHEMEESH
jgi:hypothetical protein